MNPYQNINNFQYGQMNPFSQNYNQIPTENNIIINNQQNTENSENLKADRNLLLNRIKEPIIIEAHAHPLYCCFTPEREKFSQIWTCKNCGKNYSFKIPSFYCTYCDYDFCQNCLMKLPLGKIKMMNNRKNYNVYINKNHPNYKPKLHYHHFALVRMEEYNYDEKTGPIHCKNQLCKKAIYLLKDDFYFCSLCNIYVCKDCFKKDTQNLIQMQPFGNISSLNNIQNNYNPQFTHQFSNNFNNNVIPEIPTNNIDNNNNENFIINNQDDRIINPGENHEQANNNNDLGPKMSNEYLNN